MASLTPEQQQALARANATLKAQSSKPPRDLRLPIAQEQQEVGVQGTKTSTASTAQNIRQKERLFPADIKKAEADAITADIAAKEALKKRTPGTIDALTSAPGALTAMNLGFGPAVEAQKNMYVAEGWRDASGKISDKNYSNPMLSSLGAVASELTREIPVVGQFAPLMGDRRYREYLQSRKAMEAALLPIFSGAAVTPTEAMRQVQGNLPAASDKDPSVASRKMVNRSMMLNGIADMQGQPRPFPKMGALYPNPKQGQEGQPFTTTKRPPAMKRITTEAEYDALQSGETYLDPNGNQRTKK